MSQAMARKGKLEEIFSKALHSGNDASSYYVSYRDFTSVVEVTLPEFIRLSENFTIIPQSRIVSVRRGEETLYRRHGFSFP